HFNMLSHGLYSSAGITNDGKLYTWGWNAYGQLGDGTTVDKLLPTQIGTDTNWKKVISSWVNTVALKTDGTLWGVGYSGNNSIPNTSLTFIPFPDNDWVDIGGGHGKTFAIKSNGTLWVQGRNNFYDLGIPYSTKTLTQIGTDTD